MDNNPNKSPSNHAFGNAIDLRTDEGNGWVMDERGDDCVQPTLLRLYPYFHRRGFFWAAGYESSREDAMHFEVSQQQAQRWIDGDVAVPDYGWPAGFEPPSGGGLSGAASAGAGLGGALQRDGSGDASGSGGDESVPLELIVGVAAGVCLLCVGATLCLIFVVVGIRRRKQAAREGERTEYSNGRYL